MRYLKINASQENRVLNAENYRGVTNDVMFVFAHEKINILLSVLSTVSFFFTGSP